MNTNYREIRAVYDDKTIRIYQAFSKYIAKEAVLKGKFGQNFNMNRMTWIKPSFLWMMYRCGWAEKENQEYVLAIDIKREAFDYIVQNAVASHYRGNMDHELSLEKWKEEVKKTDIICQWDPERDINGHPLEYRSIQLGLRGQAVWQYVNEWIVEISDITDYVKDLKEKKNTGVNIEPYLPQERVYPLSYGLHGTMKDMRLIE